METKINYIDYGHKDLIEKELWWQKQGLQYTSTGYGSKIPTSKMLRHNNRLYRVYCMVYSNNGSCYIIKDKQLYFLR